MNDQFSHERWGVFPTDVTSPTPSQVLGSTGTQGTAQPAPPPKPQPAPLAPPPPKGPSSFGGVISQGEADLAQG